MAKEVSRFELYKQLKKAGFPQGGVGSVMEDPDSTEKVYVPHYSELISQFVADPKDWDKVTDALARVWIDKNKK